MPKYPTDRRRYYADNMSGTGGDPGRPMSRERARGRSSTTSERKDDRDSKSRSSSSQQGGPTDSRRPGGPSTQQSSSYSSSQPYHRPPTSSTARGESYSSSARGEMMTEHRPTSAFSEATSDTTSVAGSTGESASLGRGALRGRRVLPVDIITRPRHLKTKQGGFGKKITLQANYFKLLSTTDWCLYQYSVDFSPEEDRTFVRKGLLRQQQEQLGQYIFDGSVMYTSHKLPEPLELTATRRSDEQIFAINVKLVGQLNRGDHQYIQVFNIIMRQCLDLLELRLVGRNFFDPKNKIQVHEWKLELWPGYDTSIRQHEKDILLCAEITHKVMRNENLLDILSECYQRDLHNFQQAFSSQVIGAVVLTDYNNNTYRVDDVDYNVNPKSTFKKRNGDEISYLEYYTSRYGINIRDHTQPLLVSRNKPKDRRGGKEELVYLIPELCRSTGLTDNMRSNFKLMSALAKHTRVSPADRIRKLQQFNQRLYGVQKITELFSGWNLQLDRQLVEFPGRVLPADKINFGRNSQVEVAYNANWTNDIRNQELVTCQKLNEWVVIVPTRLKRDCQNFVQCIMKVSASMNFVIEQPYVYDLLNDQAASYAQMLEQVKSKQNPMLIFCVASNNRLDRYSAIKKKCCVDRPVPTQVVLAKSLQNPKSLMSIATKVAIQMNCKVGGIPWFVSIPLTGLMVVGFDVCHDANSKNKDIGAMVASLDPHFGRYFSAVSAHTSGEELSNDFSVNLCKAIHQFKEYNKSLPKKIVIYRDGVGEGQVNYVINHEVKNIKEKLEKLYGNPDDVKLGFIIVTKRVNTRIFANQQNPPPGTVVDDVITDPSRYDFMIVSQHVGQGTVSPTSYNIIEDTTGLDPDKIQRLTYKLCHMYFNWSGTVRVPAPCQYAHKLAFLIAQAVHQSPDNQLETLLYFL